MYDGSTKLVQDIKIGDYLMGDDSNKRKILSTTRGYGDIYDVIQSNGDIYSVNKEHILSLKNCIYKNIYLNEEDRFYYLKWMELVSKNGDINCENDKIPKIFYKNFKYNSGKDLNEEIINKKNTKNEAKNYFNNVIEKQENYLKFGEILEIPIKNFIKLEKDCKECLNGYKVSVEFREKNLIFNPYKLGYSLLNKEHNNRENILKTLKINENDLFIPEEYKLNSKENRFSLLKGILDSNKYNFNSNEKQFILKFNNLLTFNKLIEDIIFISNSLGFKTKKKYINNEILIIIKKENFNKNVNKKNNKSNLMNKIEIKYNGKDDYFGFMLDGNQRYLLPDFTVTHNSSLVG